MGRRELGDYRGKFNRKRGLTHIHASTGVAAFLFLKDIGQFDNYYYEKHEVSRGKLPQIDRFVTFRVLCVHDFSLPESHGSTAKYPISQGLEGVVEALELVAEPIASLGVLNLVQTRPMVSPKFFGRI
jgi:hypothetical protein